MSGTSINIALPEAMKQEVEEIVRNDGYGNTSEFFRDLVREYQRRKQEKKLEQKLLEALESKSVPLTPDFFNEVRTRLKEKVNQKNKQPK